MCLKYKQMCQTESRINFHVPKAVWAFEVRLNGEEGTLWNTEQKKQKKKNNKSQNRIAFGNKEHTKITKIGDWVWLSLFICNTARLHTPLAPA